MMARLKSDGCVPYGGIYELNLPEKGMVGRGTNFKMLLTKVKEYRKANAVPVGLGLPGEIEREVCMKYPDECVDTDPRVPPSHVRLGLDDITEGTKVMAKFKLAGSPLVSQEEAERRALTCSKCGFNSSFSKPCSGICQVLKDLAHSLIGNRKTQYDDRLRACRICHCYNSVAVHLPLEFQTSYLSSEQRAQFEYANQEYSCWKI